MSNARTLDCRVASEAWEFEQIAQLNHRTFALEIPQHAPRPDGALVDRFHAENTYVVCMDGTRLAGMIALRHQRPFSLDQKLPGLERHLPVTAGSPCEIRLLAVEAGYRTGPVLARLLAALAGLARTRGHDLALISGTTRQLKLYAHLGFQPFGPRVGTPDASYQPMYLTLERFEAGVGQMIERLGGEQSCAPPLAWLPGPVTVSTRALAAASAQPLSHRAPEFLRLFNGVSRRLCTLTGARHVELLQGSGTTANDAIAAQLSLYNRPGLVLVNGEFGARLADHARRWRLDTIVVDRPWGHAYTRHEIERVLDLHPRASWIWAVHCETSTGVLNDLPGLAALSRERGLALCMDCVSSLGTVDVDLSETAFASGVSGKALGGVPGLALVFHRDRLPASDVLPRCLDLGFYAARGGIPFTLSSGPLAALDAALAETGTRCHHALRESAAALRQRLRLAGFETVAAESVAAPGVVSVALPPSLEAETFARGLRSRGFEIAHASPYLASRNWIQVALMAGAPAPAVMDRLIDAMAAQRQAQTESARAA